MQSNQDENKLWNGYHLIVFMMMGAVGGLMGALFNSLNVNLTKYRMNHLHRRHAIWRYVEDSHAMMAYMPGSN